MNWLSILGDIPGAVATYFNKRQEIKAEAQKRKDEFEDAIHKRRIELIAQGLAADASWELEQIRNSGWKDEYVLIVLSVPLVMCFIPGLDTFVLRGFGVLGQTPDWYQWLIGVIFTAVYGIRIWRRQQSDT